MARFQSQLPNNLIKELEELNKSTFKMMSEMTNSAAKKVCERVKVNMKKSFSDTDRLEKCLHITKIYKTPSDDAVNARVYFSGYLDEEKKHPAPLIVAAREHGSSRGETRKPFFRRSFNKKEITEEMERVQNKYLPKE